MVFTDDNIMTAIFVVSIIVVIIANIQALVMLNIILLMIREIFAMAVVIAAFLSPLLLLAYFPIIASFGFTLVFVDTRRAFMEHKMGASNSTQEMATVVNNDTTTGLEMNTLETQKSIISY